ncbi:hypothetical protein BC829DRAFT_386010 [Chytridium lagenaria]|nr:hypothetical protein BC829DRAFT_386010 [Chytridium lagenaria]
MDRFVNGYKVPLAPNEIDGMQSFESWCEEMREVQKQGIIHAEALEKVKKPATLDSAETLDVFDGVESTMANINTVASSNEESPPSRTTSPRTSTWMSSKDRIWELVEKQKIRFSAVVTAAITTPDPDQIEFTDPLQSGSPSLSPRESLTTLFTPLHGVRSLKGKRFIPNHEFVEERTLEELDTAIARHVKDGRGESVVVQALVEKRERMLYERRN